MATVSSPRPSITLSSRRTSTSTDATERANTGSVRRNRAALRDYYNLKASTDTGATRSNVEPEAGDYDSELDGQGFDPQQHVTNLLASASVEALTQADAALVSDIRGLDGEKKALVYDNYSKLIAATDTIEKMRGNMEPLDPATTALTPAIEHIVETAAQLSQVLKEHVPVRSVTKTTDDAAHKKETVKWVLQAPKMLSDLSNTGRQEDARRLWSKLQPLLDKWQHVRGVQDLRKQCEDIMG